MSQAPFKFDLYTLVLFSVPCCLCVTECRRNPQKGLVEKKIKKGGNIHCIMVFRKETSAFKAVYD